MSVTVAKLGRMYNLQPPLVWRHFDLLCSVPRPSKQEDALRRKLCDWAARRGLDHSVDDAGNLLLTKAGSQGREAAAPVALQAHLDMVCQANSGIGHDFGKDPILPKIEEGWLLAEDTTLGADNGIGVALALAALEQEDLVHPPLEVLLTVDEEAGMSGAQGLPPGLLRATRMLNLDSEEWGEFTLGCAGGCDVTASDHYEGETAPSGWLFHKITLSGLRGGHSGIDIHLGRGNANKLLVRLLRGWEKAEAIRLAAFAGGTARNALPREAWAIVALPAAAEREAKQRLEAFRALIAEELADREAGILVQIEAAEPSPLLPEAAQRRLLAALHAAPHGVRRMSGSVPGVVETSNNLGIVTIGGGAFSANLMVRSLRDSATRMLAEEIESLFLLAGCRVETGGAYPGWTPNPDSPLLAQCQQVYQREFGAPAATQVIHAGLECGIIGAKYPGLDIISFGPTIKGAHAPGEKVEIASVGRCWQLLKAILAAL